MPNPEVVDDLELDLDDLDPDVVSRVCEALPPADYVDPSDLANAVRIMSPSPPSPSGLANAVRNMSPSPLSQSPPPSFFAMVLDGWTVTPPSKPVAVSVCGSPTA